jgi:cytochrome c
MDRTVAHLNIKHFRKLLAQEIDEAKRQMSALERSAPKERSTTLKTFMIAAIAFVASTGLSCAQDLAAGETSFKKCAPCHDVGEKAKNKIGPSLNGLDERKSGTIPGFKYSDANKNSGIVWNQAQFLDYIKDPKTKIPGTIMVFLGIKDEAEANNLWAYLKQFDAEGKKK